MNSLTEMVGNAQKECVSDDALRHFRTYKYSSVDKSPISQHVLKHYVRLQIHGNPILQATTY